MTNTACVLANTLTYPEGGGLRWIYLNWALGFRALGYDVTWLEAVDRGCSTPQVLSDLASLKQELQPYGLADQVALYSRTRRRLPRVVLDQCRDFQQTADEADLLVNMAYDAPEHIVRAFRRAILIEIDPGLLQTWLSAGTIKLAQHHAYFTIGETVGRPGSGIGGAGLDWHYTPPCVALDWWPVQSAPPDAPFTTVSNWYTANEWMEDEHGVYPNDKRDGFLPYLDLPRKAAQPLELALCLSPDQQDEVNDLCSRKWRVTDATVVARSLVHYQRYIQQSRGEFSCAKPSYVRLQTAWISDRTLCYLASGKPAVVEHTGPSRFLPDAGGLFRFRSVEEAARSLEVVAADYERQCQLARELAEEYFDAKKVVQRVLERALA